MDSISKVPVIDFSDVDLNPGTPSWNIARAQVLKAAKEVGIFEIVHPAQTGREELFSRLAELFALPLETKMKNAYGKPFHGYVGQYPHVPLYESLGIDGADIFKEAQGFTDLMWPDGNPGFSETINSFTKGLLGLERVIRRMILEGLGTETYYDTQTDSLRVLLRVMHYKAPPPGSENALGLTGHTDTNFITIICEDVSGLEVVNEDGEYVPLTPSPNSFLVFIGDTFMAWSNGKLRSTYHRVTMSQNKPRFSAGLFTIPKGGYKIEAPKELVDEDNPRLYKPFDHIDFLKKYYSETKKGGQAVLKELAGI